MAALSGTRGMEHALDELTEASERFFEAQLRPLNLGAEQVEQQDLSELRASFNVIKECIAHPESFGTLKLTIQATGQVIVVQNQSTALVEVGALPTLLKRRARILSRIEQLERIQKVSAIKEEIEKIDETDEASAPRKEVLAEELAREQKLQLEAERVRQREEQLDREDRSLKFKIEMQERRTAIRQSWFERESVASLAGGLLLLALATTMIIAMFVGTQVTEIIANAFLVILGYFFGQAKREKSEKADEVKAS